MVVFLGGNAFPFPCLVLEPAHGGGNGSRSPRGNEVFPVTRKKKQLRHIFLGTSFSMVMM